MKTKKERSGKEKLEGGRGTAGDSAAEVGAISTKAELKQFLVTLRDRVTEEQAAPIYILTALNHIMHTASVQALLENETKEIARDLWLRLKQAGLNVHTPPLLFGDESVA
jgi:hypothetical protein